MKKPSTTTQNSHSDIDMEIDPDDKVDQEKIPTNSIKQKVKQKMPINDFPAILTNKDNTLKAASDAESNTLDTAEHTKNPQHPNDLPTVPFFGSGYPSISVNKDDILKAASDAKRYTSGGLQQITPWHLKRALFATSDNDCAKKAALLATRWGRGDFPVAFGRTCCGI